MGATEGHILVVDIDIHWHMLVRVDRPRVRACNTCIAHAQVDAEVYGPGFIFQENCQPALDVRSFPSPQTFSLRVDPFSLGLRAAKRVEAPGIVFTTGKEESSGRGREDREIERGFDAESESHGEGEEKQQ